MTAAGIGMPFNLTGSSGSRPAHTRVSLPSTASSPPIEMRYVETRAPEFADLGGDIRDIVELGGLEKAGLGVHQRNAHDAEGRPHFVRRHTQCRFEQQPDAPIEKLEEMAVEHDAGRVAMPPFDRKSPAVYEIGHA